MDSMNVLVIGGAGAVGGMITDRISRSHRVRIADLRPAPDDGRFEYVAGDVTDMDSLRAAVAGQDAVVYLAISRNGPRGTVGGWAEGQFDINVKGVYLVMRAAAEAGIRKAVYASSLSIFADYLAHGHELQEREPDADDDYGLSKRLGEQVGAAAAWEHGMAFVALRLCAPMSDGDYLAYRGRLPEIRTAGSDVAEAFALALDYPAHGFEPFVVCGDVDQRFITWSRTFERLGWRPQMRMEAS